MLNDYRAKANDYSGQYNSYKGAADAAQNSVKSYANYMQNEGSAGNQYHNEFEKQKTDLGYDPAQMTAARANLTQATGALSAYSDFANTAASKWGMNAGGFAAANSGALSGLNNNIASNQTVVNSLADLYKTAQTGANQFTGQVIQGEQNTMQGLQQVYANAADQRDKAASMMNFYNDMAQKQGGFNAQQAQYYAQAQQAYAAASQAMAQASLLAAQTKLANQQYTAYDKLLNPPKPAAPAPVPTINLQPAHNTVQNNVMGGMALQGGGGMLLQGGGGIRLQ